MVRHSQTRVPFLDFAPRPGRCGACIWISTVDVRTVWGAVVMRRSGPPQQGGKHFINCLCGASLRASRKLNCISRTRARRKPNKFPHSALRASRKLCTQVASFFARKLASSAFRVKMHQASKTPRRRRGSTQASKRPRRRRGMRRAKGGTSAEIKEGKYQ
eukprot:gene17021-biopygen14369